jgi:hypothetical protein
MSVPFTEGKNSEHGETCGGHTSRGVHIPEQSKIPATSNKNTRIGDLNTRTHGVGNDRRK